MASGKKIPFGVKGGILVGVEEVESGLRCGCVCPVCGRALQARKGHQVAHYFAHNPSDDDVPCESAVETAIHQMAKQILSEEQYVALPELVVKAKQLDELAEIHFMTEQVTVERTVIFDRVVVEKQLDDIRPDLIGYVDGMPILIEIYVSHKCGQEKIDKIRERGLFALEFDLSKVEHTVTKNELATLLLDGTEGKRWLSHLDVPKVKQKLQSLLARKVKAINEDILRRSRRERSRRFAVLKRTWRQYSKASAAPPETPLKEHQNRIFFCRKCRHKFSMTISEAPYSANNVVCPACGADVSTRRA